MMLDGGRAVEGNRSKSGRAGRSTLVAGAKAAKAKTRSKASSKARSKRG
jgi:hypothetical protein